MASPSLFDWKLGRILRHSDGLKGDYDVKED